MNAKIRQIVYSKFDGHCAYCGCNIKYNEMQVDHFKPLARNVPEQWLVEERGTDEIDNLMPSCRMCNFYKGRCSIEQFRYKISDMLDYKHTFATKMALKYGILHEQKWNGKFFFEHVNEHVNQ
jgi:predicted restriction endonuclease